MKIWVDADSCPVVIKNILFRAAKRTGLSLIMVANHPIQIPKRANIRFVRVTSGMDVADKEIVKNISDDDLVITADIPLAAEVLRKGCQALSPSGELFSQDTIGVRLDMRNFMEKLRASGVKTAGPQAMDQSARKAFADQLDHIITKFLNGQK